MKSGTFRRQMINIAGILGLLGGSFGNNLKPGKLDNGMDMQGFMPGNKPRKRREFRMAKRHRRGFRVRRLRKNEYVERTLALHGTNMAECKMGRGTDWIKENRRRRAYGLPQLRVVSTDPMIIMQA
jgi:predicted secreted protein